MFETILIILAITILMIAVMCADVILDWLFPPKPTIAGGWQPTPHVTVIPRFEIDPLDDGTKWYYVDGKWTKDLDDFELHVQQALSLANADRVQR